MRSEYLTSASRARRSISAVDEIVKTFFGWWTTEQSTWAPSCEPVRPPRDHPRASGEGKP